jgi:hypothetical protein
MYNMDSVYYIENGQLHSPPDFTLRKGDITVHYVSDLVLLCDQDKVFSFARNIIRITWPSDFSIYESICLDLKYKICCGLEETF